MKKIAYLVVFVLTCSFFVPSGKALGQKKIPHFAAKKLDGSSYQYEPKKQSRPLLVIFWASWCKSCKYEIPKAVAFYKQHAKAFNILGVSVDRNIKKAQKYVDKTHLPYASIIDSNLEISGLFGVRATPTLVVLDAQGTVKRTSFRFNGAVEQSLLESAGEPTSD